MGKNGKRHNFPMGKNGVGPPSQYSDIRYIYPIFSRKKCELSIGSAKTRGKTYERAILEWKTYIVLVFIDKIVKHKASQ